MEFDCIHIALSYHSQREKKYLGIIDGSRMAYEILTIPERGFSSPKRLVLTQKEFECVMNYLSANYPNNFETLFNGNDVYGGILKLECYVGNVRICKVETWDTIGNGVPGIYGYWHSQVLAENEAIKLIQTYPYISKSSRDEKVVFEEKDGTDIIVINGCEYKKYII